MPLDGHSYLVAQGWKGKGNGLRNGAISRPLAIPQKRTLAGLGKDRDEAFPFWDHLFTAAASAIKIKIHDSDDEASDSGDDSNLRPELKRTSTGILSNRRPVLGTAASSGVTTPSSDEGLSSVPTRTASLVAIAKREAARKALYSRLFRGPTLGPELSDFIEIEQVASTSKVTLDVVEIELASLDPVTEQPKVKKTKKSKEKGEKESEECSATADERKEKKRRSKEKVLDQDERKKRKGEGADSTSPEKPTAANVEADEDRRLEKKLRKERKKLEKLKVAGDENEGAYRDGDSPKLAGVEEESRENKRKKEKKKREKLDPGSSGRDGANTDAGAKKSKKRKVEEFEQSELTPTLTALGRSRDGDDKKVKKGEKKKRRREEGNAE